MGRMLDCAPTKEELDGAREATSVPPYLPGGTFKTIVSRVLSLFSHPWCLLVCIMWTEQERPPQGDVHEWPSTLAPSFWLVTSLMSCWPLGET